MEGENQKQMPDRGIRDMISSINRRLQHLHKLTGGGDIMSLHDDDDDETDDDPGHRVITLAGTNVGATMRSELDDLDSDSENDPFSALVNSNFQSVNNSLMIDASYNTNDPGVHLDIYDKQEANTKKGKKEGGTKIKSRKSSKSEHHTDGNSGD